MSIFANIRGLNLWGKDIQSVESLVVACEGVPLFFRGENNGSMYFSSQKGVNDVEVFFEDGKARAVYVNGKVLFPEATREYGA
ncbi:MAG: hypothetical protein FWE31_04800 [Firmicutes bacterium]|nr:hypothetical protein [Bacillota bacterium]